MLLSVALQTTKWGNIPHPLVVPPITLGHSCNRILMFIYATCTDTNEVGTKVAFDVIFACETRSRQTVNAPAGFFTEEVLLWPQFHF